MAVRLERFVKPPAEIAASLLSADGGACFAFHRLPSVCHRFVPMFFPGIHAGSADRVDIDCPTHFVMPKDSGPKKSANGLRPLNPESAANLSNILRSSSASCGVHSPFSGGDLTTYAVPEGTGTRCALEGEKTSYNITVGRVIPIAAENPAADGCHFRSLIGKPAYQELDG